jgi:RNA polymerase sigma-70 factor (ECF subfamily)
VKAFYNLAAFRVDSRFYTWLVRIVVNEALIKIRGKRFREVSIEAKTGAEDHLIPHGLEDWRRHLMDAYSRPSRRSGGTRSAARYSELLS